MSLLLTVATVFAMWPNSIERMRVLNAKKILSIQTSKIDPPRLAFDELHLDENKIWSEWDALKSREGTRTSVSDDIPKFAGKSAVQTLRNRKVVLKAMTFTRQEVEQRQTDLAWVETLSPQAQKRILAAQEKSGTLDEEWTLPSFREMAAQKISEVKRELSEIPIAEKILVQAQSEDGSLRTPESVRTADVQVRQDAEHLISGMVEIKGLPSGDPKWQIRIARYEDQIKKEDGRVDLKTSTFGIQVPQMSGTLLAQMVDTNSGAVIGEGSLRLSEYSASGSNRRKITIQALEHHISASFPSFYDRPTLLADAAVGQKKPVTTRVLFASLGAEGQTDRSGRYVHENIHKGSWGLMRTQAKGFYPGIYLAQSGSEKKFPLFPASMIEAMKQIIRDQTLTSEVPETGSIVWGQITQNGKPIAGAQVEVEGLENYLPIYFNALLIPDPEMKATSENGFFAFVHLPEGFHALIARHGSSYLSHANVVVDNDSITTAQLESTWQTEKTSLKVFDAFSGQAMNAQLEMQSLPVALEVRGFAEVNLASVNRLSFMNVVPENPEYVPTLQTYEDVADSIFVPLVRNDWIQNLMNSRRINSQPRTGIILGFSESSNYEALLGHDPQFSPEQIIYFDPQGEVVSKGVPGGGFVIFNAPVGVQSIVLMNAQSDLLQTQVVPVDDSGVVVLKFR